ncbi:nucleoside hydrolase [Polychaeton citri CBS 116435]|uniref:Nucleoside hydrolase n=1 Tax=Polychaeton citri CBS 116435 TaxID=1314669 RepID=A0A9P4QI59_9PEZI|nr:nucleoside hydrolase [Polychaeton citri CBS 116435]
MLSSFVHVLLSLGYARACLNGSASTAKAILVDTDIFSDVDDVGALSVTNVLHNCGLVNLLGIAINTHSEYGALAASVINTYFGNGDVPIASLRPLTKETFVDEYDHLRGEYAARLAFNFPRQLSNASDTPTPVQMYRSILSGAEAESITIISVGFLSNLAELLSSPAELPQGQSGLQLVSTKAKELVIMGGLYPSGWEYNFGGSDPDSTAYVLANWPPNVPVTYSGGELGAEIMSGQSLKDYVSTDSPIAAAYEWYVGRCSTTRESWDPITVLYGALGLDGFSEIGIKSPFEYANEYGRNSIVTANGSNAWVNDTSVRNQHWLKLAEGVRNESVAWLLDQFYMRDPLERICF